MSGANLCIKLHVRPWLSFPRPPARIIKKALGKCRSNKKELHLIGFFFFLARLPRSSSAAERISGMKHGLSCRMPLKRKYLAAKSPRGGENVLSSPSTGGTGQKPCPKRIFRSCLSSFVGNFLKQSGRNFTKLGDFSKQSIFPKIVKQKLFS